MSRVTIVPSDGFVSVDGVGVAGLDLSALPPGINAVQWFGNKGELELSPDENTGRRSNIDINDISFCRPALDAWRNAVVASQPAMDPALGV
jgi:hypothetical protein